MMVIDLLVVALLVAVVVLLTGRGLRSRPDSRPLDGPRRDELVALQSLVDDLRETAWEHRELDSLLSVIVLEKIREYERRKRPDVP